MPKFFAHTNPKIGVSQNDFTEKINTDEESLTATSKISKGGKPYANYVPAQVSVGKITRIYYYAINPISEKLERVVVKCNRIKNKTERLKYARTIADNINARLRDGWNPFVDRLGSDEYVSLAAGVEQFLNEKSKELRKDSMRSYRSYCEAFMQWLRANKYENGYICVFNENYARKYMDSLSADPKIGARTYNNSLKFQRSLFFWFISKHYADINPFQDLKTKRVDEKQRQALPPEVKQQIKHYVEKYGMTEWNVVMQLCYRCFIRPKEIMMLKVQNVDTKEWLITIPADVAKNHHERVVAIPDSLRPFFAGLVDVPKTNYIFSTGYKPGKVLKDTRDVGKTWAEMRDELGFDKCYTFYSLKDTGITEMLDAGVPAKLVKELADHHSLEMTEKYTHRASAKEVLKYDVLDF